jgi:GDSL-like Lipase/Acylhydrolase family
VHTNEIQPCVNSEERFLAKAGKFANGGLAAGAVLVLSVCFRFVYQGLSGERQFNTPFDLVLYFGLPIGVAALLLASLRLNSLKKLELLMVCAALTLSMYAIELSFELGFGSLGTAYPMMGVLQEAADKKAFASKLTKKFGNQIDIRSSGEVLDDLRKSGVDAIRILTPANHLFMGQPDGSVKSVINIDGREVVPLASVSNIVTLLCNEDGRFIHYKSDSHGFNNPDELWHSAGVNIVALGDSFTHGYCVPPEANFVARIRERYPTTLNLGIAGDGPLLMLAKMKEYVPALHPKTVLWFYYEGNDLTDLQTERKNALLTRYLEDGFTQKDLARQSEIDRAINGQLSRVKATEEENRRRRASWSIRSYLIEFVKLPVLRGKLGLVGGVDRDAILAGKDLETANMDVFRDILVQAKTQADALDTKLYFVYLPEWARYTKYRSWGEEKRDDVLKLVSGLGIPIIDINPAFQAHGDPLSLFPFRAVGHYTETGHRLVAEEVLRKISSSAAILN